MSEERTRCFGETRTFRLRRWKAKTGNHDIDVDDGSVLVLPHATNMIYTHQVPASAKRTRCRISVTVRAFSD